MFYCNPNFVAQTITHQCDSQHGGFSLDSGFTYLKSSSPFALPTIRLRSGPVSVDRWRFVRYRNQAFVLPLVIGQQHAFHPISFLEGTSISHRNLWSKLLDEGRKQHGHHAVIYFFSEVDLNWNNLIGANSLGTTIFLTIALAWYCFSLYLPIPPSTY